MFAAKCHLEATCVQVGFTRQRETQVHEVIKLVSTGSAVGAMHSAQILALEQIMNHTVALALAIVPGLVSLCTDRALASQLLVRGPTLHPVRLSLHMSTDASWQLQKAKKSPNAIVH